MTDKYYDIFNSPYVYVSLAPLLWSTNFILATVLTKSVPVPTMVVVRVFVGAIALAVLLLKRYGRQWPVPDRKDCMVLVLMGITGVFGFNMLTYTALRYTTPINAALINAFYPALTALLCIYVMGESLGANKLIGLICSLTGIFLITVRGSLGVLMALQFNAGDILAFMGCICWAVYSVAGKVAMKNLSVLAVTAYSTFSGLIFLGPLELFRLLRGEWTPPSGEAIVILIYLGIIASVAATFLWNRGVQEIGPDRTGYFYNLLPVYSALLAALFLGERIRWYHIIGGLLVLGGVILGPGKTRRGITEKTAGLEKQDDKPGHSIRL